MLPEPSFTDNRRGILFMVAAQTGFIVNDTLVKLASADLALSQILVLRGLIALPVLLAIAGPRGIAVVATALRNRLVQIRSVSESGSAAFYLTALTHMPIANATAILQTVPLMTTIVAALGFREPVGIRRWSAVFIGFAAVLAIIRPGVDGFSFWSLFALAAVFFVAARDLTSRLIPASIPPLPLIVLSACASTLIGLVMTLFEPWRPATALGLAYVGGAAAFLCVAYLFIVLAMRYGEISVVSPFRYSILLWAILIQMAVFGALPDLVTLIGSAVLVATGLYTVYRERKVRTAPRAPVKQAIPPPL